MRKAIILSYVKNCHCSDQKSNTEKNYVFEIVLAHYIGVCMQKGIAYSSAAPVICL